MFEKEAEEIANKRCHEIMCYGHCSFSSPKHHRCGEWHREYECALKGAEFGYNKANEWHYPLTLDKDGQPISDNPVAESYPIEILMYDFETGSKEVIKYDTSWAYYRKDGSSIRRNHIAWQYIAIPNKEGI